MKVSKKLAALFLSLAMVLSLAACGSGTDTTEDDTTGDDATDHGNRPEDLYHHHLRH